MEFQTGASLLKHHSQMATLVILRRIDELTFLKAQTRTRSIRVNRQRARLARQIDQVEQLRCAEILQISLQCHTYLHCNQQGRRLESFCPLRTLCISKKDIFEF